MKRVTKILIISALLTVAFSTAYSDSNSYIKLEKEKTEKNSEVLTKNLGNITEREQTAEKTGTISNVDRDSKIKYTNNLFNFTLQVPESWRQIAETETYSMWLTPEVDLRYSHVRNGAKFTVAVLKNPNNLSVREWLNKHGGEETLVITESKFVNVNNYNIQRDVLVDPQDNSYSIRTDLYVQAREHSSQLISCNFDL